MSEPTLDDAKALIARTKTMRPRCGECSEFSLHVVGIAVKSGKFPPPLDSVLHKAVRDAARAALTPDWEEDPSCFMPTFTKRCVKCEGEPAYPWAERLDAEKVLAFMQTQTGPFWLGELEALV